jgi:hypothetical protein
MKIEIFDTIFNSSEIIKLPDDTTGRFDTNPVRILRDWRVAFPDCIVKQIS